MVSSLRVQAQEDAIKLLKDSRKDAGTFVVGVPPKNMMS